MEVHETSQGAPWNVSRTSMELHEMFHGLPWTTMKCSMEVHEKFHETFRGSPWSLHGLPWNISWTSMKFHEKFPENFLKHPPLQYLTVVRAEPAPSRIVVDAILCPSSALREKPGGRTQKTSAAPAALLVAPSNDWLSLSGEPSNY